jgi:hypothetical protein
VVLVEYHTRSRAAPSERGLPTTTPRFGESELISTPITVLGVTIQGYLVWIAVIYASVGHSCEC